MNQPAAQAMRKPRTDTRLLDDIIFGLHGYWAVLVAHDLKLFPLLAAHPCTLREVCDRLQLARRPAETLLMVCVALGLIQVQDSRYGLTPLAEDHLLESSPTYFGGMLDLYITNASLWSFDSVKRTILTDAPQPYGAGELFQSHAAQADLARAFTWAMHSNSMGPALVWPDTLDLSGNQRMLDVGGGSGAHCIGATRRWPHLHGIVFDMAPVCEVAQACITRDGLQSHISTQAGDMWQDPFPAADLQFYGQSYHDWPLEKCQFLTRKSFESLAPGGRIIL